MSFEIGKHGVEIDFTVNGQPFSSTFLPEVMSEHGMDQKTTYEELCQKAGYGGGYDSVKDKIQAKTYESIKYKMTYAQYQQFMQAQ